MLDLFDISFSSPSLRSDDEYKLQKNRSGLVVCCHRKYVCSFSPYEFCDKPVEKALV